MIVKIILVSNYIFNLPELFLFSSELLLSIANILTVEKCFALLSITKLFTLVLVSCEQIKCIYVKFI